VATVLLFFIIDERSSDLSCALEVPRSFEVVAQSDPVLSYGP
jgi:hypothetical protein